VHVCSGSLDRTVRGRRGMCNAQVHLQVFSCSCKDLLHLSASMMMLWYSFKIQSSPKQTLHSCAAPRLSRGSFGDPQAWKVRQSRSAGNQSFWLTSSRNCGSGRHAKERWVHLSCKLKTSLVCWYFSSCVCAFGSSVRYHSVAV